MIPHHFFYQLVLFGLLGLFVVLYYAWPSGGVPDEQRPAKPSTPRRTRSNEPKPFAGLTHKPHCAACEHVAEAHADALPAAPPPLRTSARGRPRQVDTSDHCCPDPHCRS